MKNHSASISADRKNSSFQLNSHTQFQKLTTKHSNKINRIKERNYAWSNSLVKLDVLSFKIQVKKRENGRREEPVICGTSNLKTISSQAKNIFIFDLKSFSNLKTISLHAISNGLLYMTELIPHWSRLANDKLFLHN